MTPDAEERPTYVYDPRTGVAAPLHVRGCGGSGCADGCRDCAPDTKLDERRELAEDM